MRVWPIAIVMLACAPPETVDGPSIEGVWVGELQSGYLVSGSTRVVLEILMDDPFEATLVAGAGAAPADPTDPEVGWPPGLDPARTGLVPLADGFVYPSTGATRDGSQVHIDFAVTELWADWCALQTGYPIVPGSDEHLCLPNRPWTASPFECHFDADATHEEEPVDCQKLSLCIRTPVCACSATECMPSQDGLTLAVDMRVTDDSAVGAIVWSMGSASVSLVRE